MSKSLDELKRLYRSAKQVMQAKDFEKAIPMFEIILKAMPEEGSLWHNLGSCYLEIHDEAKAILAYEQCLTCEPCNADAAFNLGVLSTDPERASHYYKQAVELNHHGAHYNLALICMNDQPVIAKQLLHEYLEVEPNSASAQYLLAALEGETLDSAPSQFVSELFDQYAGHFDEHLKHLNYQTPKQIAVRVTGKAVLDLGCGTGLMAEYLPEDCSIVGVDLSEKMLEKAHKKRRYKALHCAEIVDFLSQSDQVFDSIIAADALVYLGDLKALFEEVQHVLKPGGQFIYSVEKSDTYPFELKASKRFAHCSQYLDECLSETGFELENRWEGVLREQGGRAVVGFIDTLSAK